MDLKVVCQKNTANEKNAPGPFIHCRGKTPGTNRLTSPNEGGQNRTIHHIDIIHSNLVNIIHRGKPTNVIHHTCDSNESYKTQDNVHMCNTHIKDRSQFCRDGGRVKINRSDRNNVT